MTSDNSDDLEKYIFLNALDPAAWAKYMNGCGLRSYQREALRGICDGVTRQEGDRYTVIFPRQSGKNETQAQMESLLLAMYAIEGGTIVKLTPTDKTQGKISRERLKTVLKGSPWLDQRKIRQSADRTEFGKAAVRYMSAQPNAAIVGATADILLEVDEAQMVSPAKFDRDAAPMAASTNAARVFWGTAWDDSTLLARETRASRRDEAEDGKRHAFLTDATVVGNEVPQYAEFVRRQVKNLGREHPVIRTQYFCEEISDLTGMFPPRRLKELRGTHAPQNGPEPDGCYVFLIDIAGSDELTVRERTSGGFGDRRDATALTICEVSRPEKAGEEPVFRTVGRRYYRNLPAEQLKQRLSDEFNHWKPQRAVVDHTGLGCLISDYLSKTFPGICRAVDITAPVKTRMAFGFLALVESGRWLEYQCDEWAVSAESPFDPKKDGFEVLDDPALLRQMFFRELRACRMETSSGGTRAGWGVPEGTRDPATGRYIHDDLVLSAALSVFALEGLPLAGLPEIQIPVPFESLGF